MSNYCSFVIVLLLDSDQLLSFLQVLGFLSQLKGTRNTRRQYTNETLFWCALFPSTNQCCFFLIHDVTNFQVQVSWSLYIIHQVKFTRILIITLYVLVGFRSAARLLRLINTQNGAHRAPPPPPTAAQCHCLYNCLPARLMNIEKIHEKSQFGKKSVNQ